VKIPLLSIVITVYNCAKYINESLQSIFNQTFKGFEIIIYDDASTDKTRQVIADFLEENTKNFVGSAHAIYGGKNVGCAEGRNRAIRKAKGKYIAILDGDDVSLPYRLEKQVKFMEKNEDISFLGGFAAKIDEEGIESGEVMDYPPEKHFDIVNMITKRNMNPMLDPTMMFRRDAFEKLGEYSFKEDRKLVPDFDLWLRAILGGYKFYNLQEPLVKYRVNREGNTLKHKKEMIRQHVVVWREFMLKYRR
jgi:glycosyltransferase involved in cell wall biosynthesis